LATISPLSDSEKQWLQNFERKLGELHSREAYNTAFLDPRQLELAEAALKKMASYSYIVYGGYPAAERNVLRVFPPSTNRPFPLSKRSGLVGQAAMKWGTVICLVQ
jgi:hypothetical protein